MRSADSLILLGDQAATVVRRFRDQHLSDAALAARCDAVLEKQREIEIPETVPAFPPAPVLRFLIQLPDLPVEKIAPLEKFYRSALVSGRDGSLTLGELTPKTMETLLLQTSAMENAAKSFRSWLARESPETFRALASEMLNDRFESSFPRLLDCQSRLDEVLRIVLAPEMAERLGEDDWKNLLMAMAEASLSTGNYLAVLDEVEEIPPGFSDNVHLLMGDKHRRHIPLGGLFQTRYPVPPEVNREILRRMITGNVSHRAWDNFLAPLEIDPLDALYLLSVFSWRVGDFAHPAVIQLQDLTDEIPDAALMTFLEGRKPNYFLLTLFAIRRPALKDRIGKMIYEGVKEDFSQYRYHLAGNCMQRFKAPDCAPGMFDEEWLSLYKRHDAEDAAQRTSLFILFTHAPRYRITPELLWEKFSLHEAELIENHAYLIKNLSTYMLETGGPELRGKILTRMMAPASADSEGAAATRPDLKTLLTLDPAEVEGLLAIQVQLFYEDSLQKSSRNFPGRLFSTSFASPRYTDNADFYRQNLEGIRRGMENEEQRPALLPLLAVCAIEDAVRAQDDGFLKDALSDCVKAYPEADGLLLGGSFSAMLLGNQDLQTQRAFAESLALPAPQYNSHWRILVLLNGEYAFLLPELFRVAEREDSSMFPLLAMIRIAPQHPEVRKRVQQALYESDDHVKACQVIETLSSMGIGLRLDAFSDARIDWMLQLDSSEALYNTRRFVDALPVEDQGLILKRLLPRLNEAAQASNGFFTFYKLFTQPEHQRMAAERMFELLASDDIKDSSYAVNELSNFGVFTPDQLRELVNNINRFKGHQNAMNIRPRLMTALCNAGESAAFLEKEIRQYAVSGDEHIQPVALRCLAGITTDPAEAQSCFDKLVWGFKNDYSWKSGKVRQISRMQGQPERVIPFLQKIILAYGTAEGTDHRFIQEAVWGLPFQTSEPEVVIPLFQHIWETACRKTGHEDVFESMLYTLEKHYPELIPEFREQMASTPLRHRLYYGYRKINQAL